MFGTLTRVLVVVALASLIAVLPAPTGAQDTAARSYEQVVQRAVDYLTTKGQTADGAFSPAAGPAITALVTTALLRHGRSPDDPVVAKSLNYLKEFVRADGGIYSEGSGHKNYETSIAMVCLQEANRNGRYDQLLKAADGFVKGYQWGNDGKTDEADVKYGGAGYGRTGDRPDLSNTSFLMDALQAAGNDKDSESVQRALVFVSRCQNLYTSHNNTPFAGKINDGGFYYTPAAGGTSQAGIDEATGGLRSYASMTYAGLKSMIYAGLTPDDERVKAALGWLKTHYDLESNPGMGTAGLYYYYQTFAKALAALGEDKLVDDKGVAHDWRKDLIETLTAKQRPDGSWINENNRWMEGDANLVTGYALLALSYAKK